MSGFVGKICTFFVIVAACFAPVVRPGYADTPHSLTYTLDDDGAKVASVPSSFEIGSVSQLSSLPYKPGYAYGGHYTVRGCSGTQVIDYTGTVQMSMQSSTTLYACWYSLVGDLDRIIALDDAGGSGGALVDSNNTGGGCGVYKLSPDGQAVGDWLNYADWARAEVVVRDISQRVWEYVSPYCCKTLGGCAYQTEVTQMYSTPSRSGYAFKGYYTGQNGTGYMIIDEYGNLVNANTVYNYLSNSNPTTIYAKWETNAGNTPQWVTISIDDDGATTGSSYRTLYRNTNPNVSNCSGYKATQSCGATTITNIGVPVKAGYTYMGHRIITALGNDFNFTNQYGNIIYDAPSSATATALWAPKVYTITLNHNGATNSPSPSTVYLKYGVGWYSDSAATTPIYSMTTIPTKPNYNFGGYGVILSGGNVNIIDSGGNFIWTSAVLTGITQSSVAWANWVSQSQSPTWITVTLNDNRNNDNPTTYSNPRVLYRNTNTGVPNCSGYRASQSCNSVPVTRITPPTVTGYTYAGHFYGSNGQGTRFTNSDGTIVYDANASTTVYANYTSNSATVHTITLAPGTGGTGQRTIYERYNQAWYRDSNGTYQITASIFDSTSNGGAGLTPPTNTSGVFNGYWTDRNGGTQVIDANGNVLVNPTYNANTQFHAHWDGASSTVTLNANGGTACATTSVTAIYGAAMPALSCAPTAPTGYHFDGYWDNSSTPVQYYNADLTSARNWDKTGAQTLYAHWVANEYTVEYYCRKEGALGGTDTAIYGEDYLVKTRAAVGCNAARGKKFMGWDVNSDGSIPYLQPGDVITFNYTTDLTLTAIYYDIATVTLNHGTDVVNNPEPDTVYFVNGDGWYSDLNATMQSTGVSPLPIKYGYVFTGYWNAESGGTQVINANGQFITTSVSNPTILYARYNRATYRVDLNDQNAITASAPNPIAYNVDDGWFNPSNNNVITSITKPTKTGYIFDGYYSGYNGSGIPVIDSDGNLLMNQNILQGLHNGDITTVYASWIQVPSSTFTVTTTNLPANTTFSFGMSAAGDFYIDWGDGTIDHIVRASANNSQVYSHTWTTSGVKTIGFAGQATAYNQSIIQDRLSAIRFGCAPGGSCNLTPGLVGGIAGSLSSIFSTIGAGNDVSLQPRFADVFSGCSNLVGNVQTLQTLFSGLSGAPVNRMFQDAFYGCVGLTGGLSAGFFGGISGAPQEAMFAGTFAGCTGLSGSIPASGLFGTISGAPAPYMYSRTFYGCSGLTGGLGAGMFGTFSGAPAEMMFQATFYLCTGLSGGIPSALFAGISGNPARGMFNQTFSGCSGLVGYVPKNLFANISSNPANAVELMMSQVFANTSLVEECPCGTTQFITGFESYWDDKVSCDIGLKPGEHWYGNTCVTDCDAGLAGGTSVSTLKANKNGSILEFPVLSSKVTTPALNVAFGNNQICYVPLEVGNGGTNSMNFRYTNATYHAGTVSSNPPSGWDPMAELIAAGVNP